MLSDSITLAVDTANSGSTTNKVFTRYSEELNKSTYVAASHTPASRDMLAFYRTAPKANGNFRGSSKVAVKFTDDLTVDGVDGSDVVAPFIIELSASVPVGASNAQSTERRQRLLALLDNDTVMDALFDQLMI